MVEITIPNNWRPRDYQFNLWEYMQGGGKRAAAVWHRRAGKDDLTLHWTATQAVQHPANYWHMLPEKEQARKAIWAAVNPHTGRRRIDEAFPHEIRANTSEQEMFIRFKNGATWQVLGSDRFNGLVGSAPRGIVFSEWSLSKPSVWPYLSPILNENGGWAFFIYTPRGRNHGYSMLQTALAEDDWFAEVLPADKTGVFTEEQLQGELRQLQAIYGPDDGRSMWEQEYFCSFSAAVPGAFYASMIEKMEQEKRITSVPHDPRHLVSTWWDIGISDDTVIWFTQEIGRELRVIDYYSSNRKGIGEYVKILKELPYNYDRCYMPHDANAQQLATGKTIIQQVEELGLKCRMVPNIPVMHGINAVRSLLPKCVFDSEKCAKGIEALRSYQREWDDKRACFKDNPLHDWSSHAADAFRYLAVGYSEKTKMGKVYQSKLPKFMPPQGRSNYVSPYS